MAGAALAAALLAIPFLSNARAALPDWIRNIESNSALETVFFALMPVPGGDVMYRRPPAETRPALRKLIEQQPKDAQLYSLLALEDEQQLDFSAAENDWKKFVQTSPDKIKAEIALADFYQRRLRPQDEINVLAEVANAPSDGSSELTPPMYQQSWRAFGRILSIVQTQGLPAEASTAYYRSWIARYPKEPAVYSRFLNFLISQKQFAEANDLIRDYQKQFPGDAIFPVKAEALVEYEQGSLPQGLRVYERSFQPLWDPELVNGYFDLLKQTQSLRKFLDEQRAALSVNPEDLKATALVFYYYQQEGKFPAAQSAITQFRMHKDSAHAEWSSHELYVCARLLEQIHEYPDAARYYFALYNVKDASDAQMQSLAGLTRVLLDAPETPIRFGSGSLSMYSDIATMDAGPGFLNGILSLILNTTDPSVEFAQAEQRATPYFHRSRAAELLRMLDAKFPQSPERAELHAKLIAYYATAAESDAVIRAGNEFLANFPRAAQRTQVALLIADSYAREGRSQDEFAIYDSVLKELATKAKGVPLGAGMAGMQSESTGIDDEQTDQEDGERADSNAEANSGVPAEMNPEGQEQGAAFQVTTTVSTARQRGAGSAEYSRVLERYLARLTELKEIPRAIGVLRNEIVRNPDDPGLYERLAVYLEQNQLGAEQEEVYKQAMARFPDRSWYNKLARFYLRRRENEEFAALTQDVVRTFSGTELEKYFQSVVNGGSPALYLQLNLYAHQRFPHNLVFVNNLLNAYQRPYTRNLEAWEALLREHWFEESELRDEYFAYLGRTGRLAMEIDSLSREAQTNGGAETFVQKNPAAGNYLAQAQLWSSHYEESAPLLKALAVEYPADQDVAGTASSVFRSLAYFQASDTDEAVRIEEELLAATPGDSQLLARIGDTFADRDLFPRAAPYWDRIPQISPGEPAGYLDAATIYWDYFDFGNALRLLDDARKKFANDNLFAYEEGAIYEGQRNYAAAIREYVKGSLTAGLDSPAEERLLQLARRSQYRDLVDRETQARVAQTDAPMAAVALRARVLETMNRKQDLGALLERALTQATTLETVTQIETLAEQKSQAKVAEHALEKEAALTSDPVTRLQTRYTLVNLYEREKDAASAQKTTEEIYRQNPKILGVVRATVDFYWNAKLYSQAIAALQQAAKDAYPELAREFAFEAARKSIDAKLCPQAREILADLSKDSPYNAQYIAAMAETYAQLGDAQGLKQFYLAELAAFRSAPLPGDAKKSEIALLRRGLIPALTKLQDYSGAVDQYIELINAFPEDESLPTEAALYASRNHLAPRVADYYAKTVRQSPRDYRWPMALARIQTALENFPAAIDAYGKAIAIRPDRLDLQIAQAGLDERLMRFDEAADDYQKIYLLSYKDPQWMEKVAEVRARQGRTADVLAALKMALIDPKPNRPAGYFEAARQLEQWGMLEQASALAQQGVQIAGGDLLALGENEPGATLYARLLTRLRHPGVAYARLQAAVSAASARFPVVEEQVATQGITAIANSDWRERVVENRMNNARTGMRAALVEMGNTVAEYFTPEEKIAFAQFVQNTATPMNSSDLAFFAIPLAQAAGLEDLEANWRYKLMVDAEAEQNPPVQLMKNYVELQQQRLRFEELAQHLEPYAARVPSRWRPYVLQQASNGYRSAQDTDGELRVLSVLPPGYMDGDHLQRYFELLLSRNPQQLLQLASQWTPWGERAAGFVLAHGSAEQAHAVVAGRSEARDPVWRSAYNALTGLYFGEASPEVNNAFLGALGDETVGERLAQKLERSRELAGDTWFYYGSRYGEYLNLTKQPQAEDFLPALLEQSPASSSGYMQLADYYVETGQAQAAIADYRHVLELTPDSVTAHDRIALAELKLGNREEALNQWRAAIHLLAAQIEEVSVPESFWVDFAQVSQHSGAQNLFSVLKPAIDPMLRAYLKKNGTYRSGELLQDAFEALHDPPAATAWLLDLSSAANDPTAVLADVCDQTWIPLAQRAPIYQRILAGKQDAVERAVGLDKDSAVGDLQQWQIRWANDMIAAKQFAAASGFLASLPAETRTVLAAQLTPVELRIAAHLGTLDATITSYRADEENAPAAETLRQVAEELRKAGDQPSARKILEFVFAREIDERHLVASSFLGLAEIRLANGDLPGAMDLLRRLNMVVGDPFTNLEPAAALLWKTGHAAEAAQFLAQLVNATPWDLSAKAQLAKDRIAARIDVPAAQQELARIASNTAASYMVRVESALGMATRPVGANLGSQELNLLAAGPQRAAIIPVQPAYSYISRLSVAQSTADSRAKLGLLAATIADYPSRQTAKYLFFEAAAEQHDDALALATLEQLPGFYSPYSYQPADDDGNQASSTNDDTAGTAQEEPQNFPGEPPLTREWQRRLHLEAAQVLERLGKLNESIQELRLAHRLEQDPQQQKEITNKITALQNEITRQQHNQERQPVLHETLEQDRLVRPRIPLTTAAQIRIEGQKP